METEQEALEGVVSKQQITALGGTVRVWLPSSTQGTEEAGNAMGWEEKGDPIPCSPWQVGMQTAGKLRQGKRLWHGIASTHGPASCRVMLRPGCGEQELPKLVLQVLGGCREHAPAEVVVLKPCPNPGKAEIRRKKFTQLWSLCPSSGW